MYNSALAKVWFKISSIILTFLYLFHISFKPLPYVLRTRLIIALIGVYFILRKRKIFLNYKVLKLILLTVLAIFPILISSLINKHFDFWFVQNIVLTLIYLLSSYGMMKLLFYYWGTDFSIIDILKLIVYAIAFHNLITALGFVFPGVGSVINMIQNQDENTQLVINSIIEFQSRFIGLGIGSFFTGGVVSSLGLLCSAVLIVQEKSKKRAFFQIFIFAFIALTGLFIARTTLIGFGLAIFYLYTPFIDVSKGVLRRYRAQNRILLVCLFLIVLLIPVLYLGIAQLTESSAFVHAFEIFLGDGGSTSSTEHMKSMYIFPDNFKTWIIGDGKFTDGSGYYMGTDIGYLRLWFYYGVIGSLFFFFQQFYSLYLIRKMANDILIDKFCVFLGLFVVIINFKGIGDINYFLFLILWFYVLKTQRCLQKK
ncbi:hypothetical protein DCO56_18765 [Sphingobacterium athyrii]|uniref:O-antigen ligase domain-containing protein n=2 Tax=Sphingobacterium athyrii TaxID=2152717 RepID=A0A363NQC3_9SPHI|nr:hypothetical protein DCO56_18765 [Sphingobacterium athyrii]